MDTGAAAVDAVVARPDPGFVVRVVVAVTKFSHGAWIVILLIPAGVGVAVGVNRHYRRVAVALGAATAGGSGAADVSAPTVSVRDLDRLDRLFTGSASAWATVRAPGGDVHPAGPHEVVVLAGELLEPARSRLVVARRRGASRVSALHVVEHLDEVRAAWREAVPDVPLTVVEAPWREVVSPTLEHAGAARRRGRTGDGGARLGRLPTVVDAAPAQPEEPTARSRTGPRSRRVGRRRGAVARDVDEEAVMRWWRLLTENGCQAASMIATSSRTSAPRRAKNWPRSIPRCLDSTAINHSVLRSAKRSSVHPSSRPMTS